MLKVFSPKCNKSSILPVNKERDDLVTGELEILDIASPVNELKQFTRLRLLIVIQSAFCTLTVYSWLNQPLQLIEVG